MNKGKKSLSIICSMALLTSILSMTGCSAGRHSAAKKENVPQSLSMVLGVHKFFPQIPMNTETLSEKVYDSCYSYGDCSAVIVDGDPFLACNYNITKPEKKIDQAKQNQLARNHTAQILSEASQTKAKTPEIDVLSALTLSAQTLKSCDSSQKHMLVFDSGLSTCDPLNFSQENLIDAPADVVVEQLQEIHAIPDLAGIDITWIGIGITCGEGQQKPTSDYKYKLQTLWEAILTAGGASSVIFDTSPLPNQEYDGDLPKCTAVPIVSGSLDLSEISTEQDIPEVMKFDENTSVKFQGDLSEFVDEQAAVEALAPIAEYLVQNPEVQICIAGMTATVRSQPDAGKELSLQRAKTCESVLLEKGVSADQLSCIGLGYTSNPLRVQDTDAQGNLIEEMAQLNRAVFLIRKNSVLMDTILQ